MLRRIILLALSVLLFVPAAVMAAGPTVTVGTGNYTAGSTVTVPLTLLTNGAQLSSLGVDLSFNAGVLSNPSVTIASGPSGAGKSVYSNVITPPAGNSVLRILIAGTINADANSPVGGTVTGGQSLLTDGTIANVTFTVASTASGQINLSATPTAADPNASEVTVAGVAGILDQTAGATAPGAPGIGTAVAGDASATVSFSAPASNGGSSITGYTVTSSPAGGTDKNAGSTATTHTVTGLANGTAYTFSVVATNAVGTSTASAASNSVTPTATATCGAAHWATLSGSTSSVFMNIAGNLTINGRPAGACDEVAIYDNTTGQIVGVFHASNSSGPGIYGDLTIYGDASSTSAVEGAVAGDTLSIRVWDGIAQQEYQNVAPSVPNGTIPGHTNYNPPTVPFAFSANALLNLDINVVPGIQLTLNPGWNMIGWVTGSGYYDPSITAPLASEMANSGSASSSALSNVFGTAGLSTADNYLFIGPGGDVYIPGSRFNTMKKLLPGKGYWVKVGGAKSITVPGNALAATDQVPLDAGWAQVGYWGVDGAAPATGFTCVSGKYNVILDESGNVYIPGSRFNTLTNLKANRGYFIHMTAPATLTYQCQ